MSVVGYLRRSSKWAWVVAASSIVIVVGLVLAITVAIENHNDHELGDRIAQSESELMVVGGQIAEIKNHQFGTMSEYIEAYARIEPLLNTYDHKLQQLSDLCNIAQERDRQQRLIHMRRLFGRYHPEAWRDAREIIGLVRQINEVTKKEASVIHDMAALPAQEQLQFWHEEFMPLAAEEHALREKLLLAGRKVSPDGRTQ
jgi:hypothetical protein